jgi:leucyl-tRNA synthetase
VALRRQVHKAVEQVGRDIETFGFNKAVARLYELANGLAAFTARDEADRWALREACEMLARLAMPMVPHLAEELWARLGHAGLLADRAWPEADAALTRDESVIVAVQVNGKLRARLELARDLEEGLVRAAALSEEAVLKHLEGKEPRKVIVVPNRVVNIVA